jgi:hypothetical protein
MQPLKDTDFVYILGRGSRWHDGELMFSLRSLCKFVPHRRVIVVGAKPSWLGNVLHIPAVDDQAGKLQNAIQKIRIACQLPGLTDEFVLMNDDFFFLKEHDEIITFTNGTLKKMELDHKTQAGYYFAAIQSTLELLRRSGIDEPLNYEHHRPMLINKTNFLKAIDAIDWQDNLYLFRSIYGNTFKVPSLEKKDCKIFSANNLSRFDGGDIISTDNPVVLSKKFRDWIKAKFPTKSKYEISTKIKVGH